MTNVTIRKAFICLSVIVASFLINENDILAATFTVSSTGDQTDSATGDGVCATSLSTCTVRAAIAEANALSGADIIHFDIPTSDSGYINPDGSRDSTMEPAGTYPTTENGYFLIKLATALSITDDAGLSIDGYTQPNSERNSASFGQTLNTKLMINLDTQPTGSAINVTGDNLHITGLCITFQTNLSTGLFFSSSSNNWIEGNFFGSDINGENGVGSGKIVAQGSSNNLIVGTNGDGVGDRGEFNLSMGSSTHSKIHLDGMQTGHVVAGNYVGVDRTSRTCTTGSFRRSAIFFSTGISNSRIGSNFDGLSDLEEANIFACVNEDTRAIVRLSEVSDSVIQGNYIGTNLYEDDLSDVAIPGIHDNQLVSNVIILKNVIANNGQQGIGIRDDLVSGVTFRENRIFDNGMLEIDLNDQIPGVTLNDIGDLDLDYNEQMNFPIIIDAQYIGGGEYHITGTLDNEVSGEGPFTVEVCHSSEDESGYGGCFNSIGLTDNIPQGIGGLTAWSVTAHIDGDNGTQQRVFSALATNSNGSTSEFSENFEGFGTRLYPITLLSPTNGYQTEDDNITLNWEPSEDPDLSHYELYIDGQLHTTLTPNLTQYIESEITAGEHSWQVKGVRVNGSISGVAEVRTFERIAVEEENESSPPTINVSSYHLVNSTRSNTITEQEVRSPDLEKPLSDNNNSTDIDTDPHPNPVGEITKSEENQKLDQKSISSTVLTIIAISAVTGSSGIIVFLLRKGYRPFK